MPWGYSSTGRANEWHANMGVRLNWAPAAFAPPKENNKNLKIQAVRKGGFLHIQSQMKGEI